MLSSSCPIPWVQLPPRPRNIPRPIVELRRGAPSVALLTLKLDRAEDFVFKAVNTSVWPRLASARRARIRLPARLKELPLIELMIRLVPDGKMSRWLQETAKVGDRVKLQAPLGSFGIDDRASRHVFVAGGTGLAPVLSMIRSLRDRGQSALLCFGCTRRQELFYELELAALVATMPELEVRIAVMEGADGDLRTGTAVSLLLKEDFDAATVCYLCGPPPMVDAARKALTSHGVAAHGDPCRALSARRLEPSSSHLIRAGRLSAPRGREEHWVRILPITG